MHTTQDTLARWGSALLLLAPLIMVVVAYGALPSFIDETGMAKIQGELLDIHNDRTLALASVSVQLAAAAVTLISGTYLAAKLRGAAWPALAAASFAIVAASLFVVSAGLMDAVVRVADHVAGGDDSRSTLALGRALSESHNLTLGMTMFGIAGWVTFSSIAILQTGIYARGAAYIGLGAGVGMLLSLPGDVSDAFYAFALIGALCMLIWSFWLAIATVRGDRSTAASKPFVAQPAASPT